MRKFKTIFSYCVFFLVSFNLVAQNFDSVSIKTTKVSGSVYMLEGSGGNIGVLIGNDGIIIIDDEYAPLSEKIKKALGVLSNKPLKFIINTHYHDDHADGNKVLAGEGAIIVAHENTRKRLSANQINTVIKMEQKAYPYEALPKITFSESVTFNMNSETVQVYYVKNAHTDGDAIIYFKESNVLHAGDVFVRYGLPFIDQENGGSIDGMILGADQILKIINDETKIIPGHGQISYKKDLIDFKNMLQTVRNRVADGIKAGKTIDQIINSDPAKEYKAVFDKAFFIQTVYSSIKK
jgi:cyclase